MVLENSEIFSLRHEINQLQLILNVNKIIVLIFILTDSWDQSKIAFWLMFNLQ